MELNSKIAAGMTLYLYHRSNQSVLNQFILLEDGTSFLWENSYIEKVERGYKPVLGVMIAPMDKLSIGLSLAKTFVYSSSVDVQSSGVDQAAIVSLPTTTGDSTTPEYPLEVRLGAAYFPTNSLLLSADLSYYTKVENPNGDRVNVVNLALGTEYFLDKNWAVRGGLFTNMANSPELDPTRFNQDEKVDLYGMSLSISNFTRNTSVSFGGSITSGSGKAQIQRDVSNIQNVDVQGWLIFLSSSYSY
jgi:long-chain fatty acid transport protein